MNKNTFSRNALGPEDLRLAGRAFETALSEVGDSDLHPYTIRKTLAQHVMGDILAGERDLDQIALNAITALRELEARDGQASTQANSGLASLADA
jgi:hypothetical protein